MYKDGKLPALMREDRAAAKAQILQAFLATRGNATKAANVLGVSHRTLCRYTEALGCRGDVKAIREASSP